MPELSDSEYVIIIEALDHRLSSIQGEVRGPIEELRKRLHHHRLAMLSFKRACERKYRPTLTLPQRIAAGDKIAAKSIGQLLFGKGPK